jgi:hypothetical protein
VWGAEFPRIPGLWRLHTKFSDAFSIHISPLLLFLSVLCQLLIVQVIG